MMLGDIVVDDLQDIANNFATLLSETFVIPDSNYSMPTHGHSFHYRIDQCAICKAIKGNRS